MFTMINSIFNSIRKSQQRRADYWILHNMTDKELEDVGINRGELYHRVYNG